jgi:hypothetical protein
MFRGEAAMYGNGYTAKLLGGCQVSGVARDGWEHASLQTPDLAIRQEQLKSRQYFCVTLVVVQGLTGVVERGYTLALVTNKSIFKERVYHAEF